MKQIRALTGLRGIAALWVVALHYTAGTGTGFWLDLAAAGNAGVTVFFLLSGYILSYVYDSNFAKSPAANCGRYMWARFARIYPLHLATLIVWGLIFVAGFEKPGPNDNTLTFLLNLALVQAWGLTDLSWNAPAWTISVELFCYLLFPLVAFLLARRHVSVSAVMLGISLYFVAAVPYGTALDLLGLQRSNPYSYGFYVIHFAWMFLAGMAIFRIASALQERRIQQACYDGLMIAGLCIIIFNARPPLVDWPIAVGAAFVILGLSTDKGLGGLLFGNPVAVFLGEISYAVYLTHVLTFWALYRYFSLVAPITFCVIAIGVSAAVHYLFERPARDWLRNLTSRPAHPQKAGSCQPVS